MSKTIAQIIAEAEEIRVETDPNANTAERVGTAIKDVAEYVEGVEEGTDVFLNVAENGFFLVDTDLNIGFCVDEDGCHAINLLEYELVE